MLYKSAFIFIEKMDGLQAIRHFIFFLSCSSREYISLLGPTLNWTKKSISNSEETEGNLSVVRLNHVCP